VTCTFKSGHSPKPSSCVVRGRILAGHTQTRQAGATIFAYQVRDLERYGVVPFNKVGKPSHTREKPIETR
jgi:dTDP-glucose pyrophosphorylase